MALTWALADVALVCCFTLTVFVLCRRRHPPYPPGPPKKLVLGNLLDMPSKYEYLKFREWSEIYGPVLHLTVPRQNIIVLNKLEIALDLMDRKSSKYSDRPHMTMLQDVIGWDWSVVLFDYGEKFTRYRRLLHKGLHGDVVHHQQIQEEETQKLLAELARHPLGFLSHIEYWSKAVILRTTYGYNPKGEDDRFIWLADRCVEAITKTGQPGAYLVDTFPFLKWVPSWVPFAGFKREAHAWSLLVREALDSPMDYVKQTMKAGKVEHNYVSNLLRINAGKELDDDEDAEKAIKETAAIVHTAGADSVYSIVQSFILAMALYPHVQEKAQAEIDAVIGPERLPQFSDRTRLPYIEHLLSELLRWARAVPLGIAHQLRSDDIYKGMYLPAKSIVMANVWSISMDESMYKTPEIFIPERFESPGVQDPRAYAFGFGRRICAGKDHAESAVWIAIVSILATMQVSKALNARGEAITPAVEYTQGLICKPKPFVCDIRARKDRKGLF